MGNIANQNYRDNEGQMRTFTEIDHDIKPTINTTVGLNREELDKALKADRMLYHDKILSLPASACPSIFDDFRTKDDEKISWNREMITDASIPFEQLYNIYTLTSKRVEMHTKGSA